MLVIGNVVIMFPRDKYSTVRSCVVVTCLERVCVCVCYMTTSLMIVQAKLKAVVCFVLGVTLKPWCCATSC